MICLIALVAFGMLGVFSAKYRTLAKEAFNCVFRRITLRRCETGFDRRMKAKITGKIMARSPKAAGLIHRHFEAISWAFTILMIASAILSAQALYYYAVYGNCNGKQGGFCIFNSVTGQNGALSLSEIPLDMFPSMGPENAPVQIAEFGCFQCQYTKAAEPEVKKILEKYAGKVHFTFVYTPIPHHSNAIHAAEAAACAADQGGFWPYHDSLFENQDAFSNAVAPGDALRTFKSLAEKAGLNATEFEGCINSGTASGQVQQSIDYAKRLGITQTPTFYINGNKISGTISEKDIEKALY